MKKSQGQQAENYDHKKIEPKWQKRWERDGIYRAKDEKAGEKFYGLIEFPYPSGDGMHVGHIRSNTAMDIITRKRRMEGYNVLYPIGWDAFGLPTENYAIKTGTSPRVVTKRNTDNFRRQLKALGFGFDWSREVNTSDPHYYRWTQWIFLEMLKRGLAYKKKMEINWCPKDKIGLANEEVVDGRCERCGTLVERREKEQWMLAITKYADRLDRDLDAYLENPEGDKVFLSEEFLKNPEAFGYEVPLRVDKKNPPVAGKKSVTRRNIHALVYDPKTDTFLCLKWKKFPWTTLLVGGVEDGENMIDAAKREVREETGYKNLRFIRALGGPVRGEYFAAHKDENRVALTTALLFELQDDARDPVAPEESAKFDAIWLPLKEMTLEKMTCAELDVWLERLQAAKVDYLEKIKIQQRNWIGRSEGVNFKCKIKDLGIEVQMYNSVPQTYRAETFTVIAPEHPLVKRLVNGTKYEKPVLEFVEKLAKKKAANKFDVDKEMEGIFTGRYVENFAGTGRDLPIWIASYVVMEYGTGMVNCSAHDTRDFAFAKKFNIPLHEVAEPLVVSNHASDAIQSGLPFAERNAVVCVVKHWSEEKYLCLKWKANDWKGFVIGGIEDNESPTDAGIREVREETGYKNVSFLGKLGGTVHSQFYHAVKKVNRFAHFMPILLELRDGERSEISAEESALHEVVWLKKEEVAGFVNREDMRLIWDRCLGIERPIVKNGILIEPNEFKGREWREVRHDIIDYLVKKGYAERAFNYKLRDWIFSRQRYWGEPIPVVHCEKCITRKALLIHGFEGKGDNHWFPWLKAELEKRGIQVYAPTMSSSKHPTVESWMAELLPLVKDFGPKDLIIGHSLGSNAALQLILHAKKHIGNLFLVASAVGHPRSEEFWKKLQGDWDGSDVDSLEKFWKSKIDYAKAAKLASSVMLIRSLDDDVIPKDTHENLPKEWKLLEWNGYGHFDFLQPFPELFELIKPAISEGWIPLPESALPLKLPEVKHYQPTDTGESPLAAMTKWVKTKCPDCGGPARRETDTMPNWAGSSWYYLRYADPKNARSLAARGKLDYWTPVDWYNGGMEHTVLHLLYSRFWHKFLYDIGRVPTIEPYMKRTSHGLILAADGEKMSKSRGNVVNPDGLVEIYGADSVRLYEMFMGPFDQAVIWQSDSIVGTRRFLERAWRFQQEHLRKSSVTSATKGTHSESVGGFTDGEDSTLKSSLNLMIKKVSEEIEQMRFNTCVSSFMIMLNEFEKKDFVPLAYWRDYLKLLAPFAPHITEELWAQLGVEAGKKSVHKKSIHLESWPVFDSTQIGKGSKKMIIQINSKTRSTLEVFGEIVQNELEKQALALPEIQKWTAGKKVLKIIVVKDRLVNIVVA